MPAAVVFIEACARALPNNAAMPTISIIRLFATALGLVGNKPFFMIVEAQRYAFQVASKMIDDR